MKDNICPDADVPLCLWEFCDLSHQADVLRFTRHQLLIRQCWRLGICLPKPSFLIVSVIINTGEMKCQRRTHPSESSKHTELNKSTGPIVNDPLQSLSLKKFHLKVLKNVRGLIMWWEHRATRQPFPPAASRKPLL